MSNAPLAALLADRLHGVQLRPPRPRRQRRHTSLRGRTRVRGPRCRDRGGGGRANCTAVVGSVLALVAAADGLSISKLALWEPPFIPEGEPRPPADTARIYTEFVEAGRRGDAVDTSCRRWSGCPTSSSPRRVRPPCGRSRKRWRTPSRMTRRSWATTTYLLTHLVGEGSDPRDGRRRSFPWMSVTARRSRTSPPTPSPRSWTVRPTTFRRT